MYSGNPTDPIISNSIKENDPATWQQGLKIKGKYQHRNKYMPPGNRMIKACIPAEEKKQRSFGNITYESECYC